MLCICLSYRVMMYQVLNSRISLHKHAHYGVLPLLPLLSSVLSMQQTSLIMQGYHVRLSGSALESEVDPCQNSQLPVASHMPLTGRSV